MSDAKNASAEEPVLALTAGGAQVWTLGGVAAVMPAPDEQWPAQVKVAWRRRLMANLTLHCECGATAQLLSGRAGRMEHQGDCPAETGNFLALLEAAQP